jgi:predicted ATP-grasp superfamily ATP-dependent carboligase
LREARLRAFIYELICAGGLGDDPPVSLRREGWAMLAAVVADFRRIPGAHVLTLLDAHLPPLGDRCVRCTPADEPQAFRAVAAQADAALIIAPEPGDLLATRSDWALAHCPLLGCQPATIRHVSDKLRLASLLGRQGVPTPLTCPLGDVPREAPFPRVLKPRCGAGAQATFVVEDAAAWPGAVAAAGAELPDQDFIVQRYHAGVPASVAVLCGRAQTLLTPGALQTIRRDARLHYDGGSVPLPPPFRARAQRLALAVCAAVPTGVPPLFGYVGVDVVLGDASDGSEDVVIEINPRLTTSYVGLRGLARENLADVLWRLFRDERVAELSWREEAITFAACGSATP